MCWRVAGLISKPAVAAVLAGTGSRVAGVFRRGEEAATGQYQRMEPSDTAAGCLSA
jgi:hypothetical protein